MFVAGPQLLQEVLIEQDPSGWRMMCGCIMLNLTSRRQVDGVWPELFRCWPTAADLTLAVRDDVEGVVRPLGLQRRRAKTLQEFSRWWVITDDHTAGIVDMAAPGVGEYARDSWMIIKMGTWPHWDVVDHALVGYLKRTKVEMS